MGIVFEWSSLEEVDQAEDAMEVAVETELGEEEDLGVEVVVALPGGHSTES
jgi:hypothetical protein